MPIHQTYLNVVYVVYNEYGTISNKLNYMTFVEQLNTIKAKQLYLTPPVSSVNRIITPFTQPEIL